MKKFTHAILSIAVLFLVSITIQSSHSRSKEGYISLSIDLSADRTFAVNGDKEGIDVIDIKTGTVTNTILLDKEIKAVDVDEQQKILTAVGDRNLFIVSTDTLQITNRISISEKPTSVVIDHESGRALITHEEQGVAIVDLNTNKILTEIGVSKKPVSSAVDPGLRLAVIAHQTWGKENDKDDKKENADRDNVTIIDLNTFSIVKTLQAGKNPRHVVINPDTHQAVVTNEKSNDLTIIDLSTGTVIATIPVQKHPKASSFNDCLNTLSVIGGEDKSWLQVIDAEALTTKASYSFDQKLEDIKVHPYLNKAVIAGKGELTIHDLPNPVPELISISPDNAQRGGASFNVTLPGKGLLATTEIYLNGNKTGSTFLTCGSMTALLPDTYLANAGTVEIKAVNPAPEGGTSNILYLTINNPVPAITELQPSQITVGSPGQTLTVIGSGFFADTVIYVNNSQRTFTLIDSARIEIHLTEAELASSGSINIMATNPSPGGGDSQVVVLTVTKPASNVDPLPEGSYGKQYEDLVPADATIEAYTPKRFAIVTGLVKDRNQNPISGVNISFLGLPEYGTARTDAEGRFNLPVDGGGTLTVVFEKSGLIASHRKVNVPWNDMVNTETITMLSEDPKSSTITFDGNPSTVMVHTSSAVTNDRGSRSLTMVFTGDNRAVATDANGQQTVLTTFTTRATEFDTPESMPAKLPPTSAYTYCSELSVDSAKNVKFDKPVTVYVDNFIGFPVGEIVPVGYYDRQRGVWVASDNGVVVRLLDTNGDGIIDALDSTGDGLPDDLNGNGSLSDEVAGLNDPTKYKPNSTHWRVKVDHFTPLDCNWPYGPPTDATEPNPGGYPISDEQTDDDDTDCTGSYCERRNRIFHEDVPIVGTDMTLHYTSNRVSGYKTVVTIPASGGAVPASLTKIIVRMEVAGRVFETLLPPQPNQKVEFVWDGLDHLGRPVYGSRVANISIGFNYKMLYYVPASSSVSAFGATGTRRVTVIPAPMDYVLWKHSTLTLRGKGYNSIVDGWTLSVHHYLNPWDTHMLIKGDGTTSENDISIITTIAGDGYSWFHGDGGPPTWAGLPSPYGIAVDSAGNVYIADPSINRIRKVDYSGVRATITTIAGGAYGGYCGEDGAFATWVCLSSPYGVAVDGAGNIYIADGGNNRIRKVDTSGVINTIAGNGQSGFSGDGGPATQARLYSPHGVVVDSAGNVYIADSRNNRIRKVDTSGVITTIAGNGQSGFSGDGGPATQAKLDYPMGVAVDSAGNIYIVDSSNSRIRKVDVGGIIATVAGNGQPGFSGDGWPASQASLRYPTGVTVDAAGNIYIADSSNYRIRKVDTSGIITTVAGNGQWGFSGDGNLATQASLRYPTGVAVDSAGNIYIADTYNYRIRKVAPPSAFAGYLSSGDIPFAEENGMGYIISSTGLHKSTIDLTTGKTLLTFGYNDNNQIISVADRFDNQTTIQRDTNGIPVSITSPDGQVIGLTIDGSNRLIGITNPDGSSYSFGYTPDGLLTDKYDPRNSHFIHQYDSNGRITNVYDPEEGHWNYSRTVDTAGNILSAVQTGEGNRFTYQDRTDSTGAYTSMKTDPTSAVTTVSRSSDGLTETTNLPCGMKISSNYNFDSEYKFKHLSESTTTSPAGLTLTTSFSKTYQDTNADNKPDLITDKKIKNSKTWTTNNNTLTGIITSTSPLGRTTTATYDPTNLLTKKITVPGLTPIQFSYDTRGRLVSSSTGSRITTVSYDSNGNLDYLITPDNRKFDYTYDSMSRLTELLTPNSELMTFGYDPNSNMTVLTNPRNVANGFEYTAIDQRKTWNTPLSGGYQYTYNKERKLKTVTFPSGKVISNTYTNGLLTSTTTPEGTMSYSYGCSSNLTGAVRGSEKVSYAYDGSLIKTDTRVGTLNQTISYTYNNDFNLSSITYAGATQSFGYDNDGLLTTAGAYTITRNAQNGLPTAVSDSKFKLVRIFNGYGEMDENTFSVNNTPLYDWTVTRDNAGRITQKADNMQGAAIIWDYGYDTLGRLTEVKQNNAVVESYTYNANGNRLTETNTLRGISGKSYSYSTEDHVLTAGTDTYQFDKDGFLTSKITSDGTTTFNYSSRGELLSGTLPNGTAISYDHDPMGRRIAKRVNGMVVEKYPWQGMTRLLAVYDGSNNLILRFAYADSRMPVSMTKGGVTYYLFYDQIGSLRAVVDSTGNITKEVVYDSFGSIIYDSNASFSVPFGFAGGLHDRDTGLVRFGFRDYDPAIGRWTAKDPIDFAGRDVNLFNYVANNPVNWIDPLGLEIIYNKPPPDTVPPTGKTLDALNCLDECSGSGDLLVTGGAETSGHSKGSSHYEGKACDIAGKKNNELPDDTTMKNCAKKCGFTHGQYETFSNDNKDHWHFQIGPNLGVPAL